MRFGNFMTRATLLFLSAGHCLACTWRNGKLSDTQCFADNPEGKEQFTAFLQTHRDPAYLLTDLVEEDFRYETVPHLRGGERAALMQRKFEQYYRNTPFRQMQLLQRRKQGRCDDEVLFSGLTNPALLSPWLNTMLAHGTPLAGIYSVPNISAPLVQDISSGHLLLLSLEKSAGLRQTYFDAKRLRFSRLTPLGDGDSFGEAVAKETARTHQYLKSLSLLPQGQALDVHIICHADDRLGLKARLDGGDGMRYAYLDIREVGQRIGATTVQSGPDATPLFLHLLAIRTPRSHYGSAAHTHFFRLLQIRRSLFGLSAALAAASLFWSGGNILEGRALHDESEALKTQSSQLTRQTQQIVQSFPGTLSAATDMKTAVLLSRKLDGAFPPPQNALDGISATLDEFPTIRVGQLGWQTEMVQMSSAAATLLGTSAHDAEILGAENNRAEPGSAAQVILLNGELAEFSGDYRSALEYLQRFQQALSKRGYLVAAQSLPLDISPQGSIAAEDAAGDARHAPFSLKIIWKAAA
jgi:hypothetical protein